jgi:hypothetical protein
MIPKRRLWLLVLILNGGLLWAHTRCGVKTSLIPPPESEDASGKVQTEQPSCDPDLDVCEPTAKIKEFLDEKK